MNGAMCSVAGHHKRANPARWAPLLLVALAGACRAEPAPPAQAIASPASDAASRAGDAPPAGRDDGRAPAPGADPAGEAVPGAEPATPDPDPAGATTGHPGEATTEAPAVRASGGDDTDGAPTPAGDDEPHRVLILGDSLAATGFGVLLEKALDADPRVVAYRKGKSASGLARPDFFDWVDQARRQIEFREPELVVVILGGNDGQDLTPARWHKARARWPSPDWEAGYRKRVDALLDTLIAPGRRVLWLALPRTRTVKFEGKLEVIRRIQREAVQARAPAATYLETTPFLQADDGSLLRTAADHGKQRPLRADDGIHFTMTGSRYLAERVAPAVLAALGLEPAPSP